MLVHWTELKRCMVKMKELARKIIVKPLVSEKSMSKIHDKVYSFVVNRKANKIEISKAVEELFGVDVLKVNTMNCRGRYVRYGRSSGHKPDWKKAIVTLKKNSKTIEFFDNLV